MDVVLRIRNFVNMGHAFICEYCECYHTATDGCDEYDQNRANRIMVNNETQKENEMIQKERDDD